MNCKYFTQLLTIIDSRRKAGIIVLILTIKTGGIVMSKKVTGTCALCGKTIKLSFEHIPDKKAGNSEPVKTLDGNTIFKNGYGYNYINNQKGSGGYYLCEDCNNKTGSWYGVYYNDFSNKISMHINDIMEKRINTVEIEHIYPLRIIKQICSMFCSINRNDSRIDTLIKFVMNKEANDINPLKYRILLEFTNSEEFIYIGLHDECDICFRDDASAVLHKEYLVSELILKPLKFTLLLNPVPEAEYNGDITFFSKFKYNEQTDLSIPIKGDMNV